MSKNDHGSGIYYAFNPQNNAICPGCDTRWHDRSIESRGYMVISYCKQANRCHPPKLLQGLIRTKADIAAGGRKQHYDR